MDMDSIVQALECLVWLGFMVAMIFIAMRKRKQSGHDLYTLTAYGLIGCGTLLAILFLFGGGALGFYCGLPAVFLAFAGMIMLLNRSNNPT